MTWRTAANRRLLAALLCCLASLDRATVWAVDDPSAEAHELFREAHEALESIQHDVDTLLARLRSRGVAVPSSYSQRRGAASGGKEVANVTGQQDVSRNVHAFYYPWYGNPEHDGRYLHWNHEYIPHWQKQVNDQYAHLKGRSHKPPNDVAAVFYPTLGAYSSVDESVINDHMLQFKQAGVGVLVTSWFPPGKHDDHGIPLDPLMPTLLDIAHAHGIEVAFHLEPYHDRTAVSVAADLRHLDTHYFAHPAVHKRCPPTSDGPYDCDSKRTVVYVYDSYQVPAPEWARVLRPGSKGSIRGRLGDAIVLGLWVEVEHGKDIRSGGFDGFYTYFASPISYGSNPRNWAHMARFAESDRLLFVPCVGPGYDDTPVRPWNGRSTVLRRSGETYKSAFRRAASLQPTPAVIAITSFNEWHEGTQIEKAAANPPTTAGDADVDRRYATYAPGSDDLYLVLTRSLVTEFLSR